MDLNRRPFRIPAIDDRLGDALEAATRAHHRRRLTRHGWADALDPSPAVDDDWWAPRAKMRDGNRLEVLIDGSAALPEIERAIAGAEHSVHIAGWHASPDFTLSPGPDAAPLRDVLAAAAERVPTRLLLWAGAPLPVITPARKLVAKARAEFVRDSRMECALDRRERSMHCHHEKIVVIDDRVAYVGGIDLTALSGNRFDSPDHPRADSLGWHDCATRLEGPAVEDVAGHFRHRWQEVTGRTIPAPRPQPVAGTSSVQVLRTVPDGTYEFLPDGEFTILQAYLRALAAATSFIHLENQFLWSPEVVDVLIDKLRNPPSEEFRVLLVLPAHPNNGGDTTCGQLGRLIAADDDAGRLLAVTVIGPTARGAGVYVHAKVGIVDDRWLTVGSANLNEHSLFNDTEMNVLTDDRALARDTRLRLWAEHTGRPLAELDGPVHEVVDGLWCRICDEQDAISARGGEPKHRVRRLSGLSRRLDRLQGPLRGLVVDG
ncbi:phospholipase D family protein [Luteipulveratus sp. YIM 133132]|uniref:phospholipase D-like domain-containing protein n=1 Tax=Luteipulveratus flavus TaxID=3031728 RepID=UPI0023AEAD54|nr:phospholipase D family protein [Luteipulveratus sp. YIM 133132]MDE9364040.1 phospholipase D family protein [Luteipulveratus sp. YIM 133132]